MQMDRKLGLNPAQRDAVGTLTGPVLVLAGAGTGKTRVITVRIAEVISTGTPANRILAVTFTNKAAEEMAERLAALLGRPRGRDRPFIGTFHALCVDILRSEIGHIGRPSEFVIFDRSDQESTARSVLRSLSPADALEPEETSSVDLRAERRNNGPKLRPRDLLIQISRWKTAGLRAGAVVALLDRRGGEPAEHFAAEAYRRYESALMAAGALDFDDLLLCTEELFTRHPAALARQQARWDHILVDEWQDTNLAQYRLVAALARPHRNLCVVGDDDQSIYGFRGARVQNILGFDRDFPDATVIRLEENYRCSAPILALANRLIANNPHRHAKTLRAARGSGPKPRLVDQPDELAEARWVVDDIRRGIAAGAPPDRFAILFRTNEQTRAFETELRLVGLPYVIIGGTSFFDRKEVRDVLSYLRVLVNPKDELSLRRVINVPPRGLGPAAVQALTERAVRLGLSLWAAMDGAGSDPAVGRRVGKRLEDFQAMLAPWRKRFCLPPSPDVTLADGVRGLLDAVEYRAEITRLYPDVDAQLARWNSALDVAEALAEYQASSEAPSLADFLRQTALWGRDDDTDRENKLRGKAVVLITLHSAKGLEFPEVYLVGMEEGLLPHERSLASGEPDDMAEERRLCYVGITRAQERLTLTRARARTRRGKPRECLPSRFLFEMVGRSIPADVLVKMEASAEQRGRRASRTS